MVAAVSISYTATSLADIAAAFDARSDRCAGSANAANTLRDQLANQSAARAWAEAAVQLRATTLEPDPKAQALADALDKIAGCNERPGHVAYLTKAEAAAIAVRAIAAWEGK